MDFQKQVYFFQDKDYFEVQKTWELNRNDPLEKHKQQRPKKKSVDNFI